MDRRRFVPSSEGLEGRALLSGTTGSTGGLLQGLLQTSASASNDSTDIPTTYRLKSLRIDHLPFYLRQLQPNRYLPKSAIVPLQNDLYAILGKLEPPGTIALTQFNLQVRATEPHASLSLVNALKLNTLFSDVVARTGASPQAVANLTQDMSAFARIDANSPNPVYLVTNDYATILQSILQIGHPIKTPDVPVLGGGEGVRDATHGGGVSRTSIPTLVGTYDAGGVIYPGTQIQLVDAAGNVYGQGDVIITGGLTDQGAPKVPSTTGEYRINLNQALSNGTYVFHVRAKDAQGDLSNLSARFILKVKAPAPQVQATVTHTPPGGPLAVQ